MENRDIQVRSQSRQNKGATLDDAIVEAFSICSNGDVPQLYFLDVA